MARRSMPVGTDSTATFARKVEILEREMAAQRVAIERLKQMAQPNHRLRDADHQPAKPSA